MQLTRYTDYSLRVLIYLAIQEEGLRITIAEISEHFEIPKNHLVKVVHHLGKLGYVKTTRGKHGGICLAKKPADLCVGDIIRNMENNFKMVDCQVPAPCPIIPVCLLPRILSTAKAAFLDVLDQYTIADLLKQSDQLKTLLGTGDVFDKYEEIKSITIEPITQ